MLIAPFAAGSLLAVVLAGMTLVMGIGMVLCVIKYCFGVDMASGIGRGDIALIAGLFLGGIVFLVLGAVVHRHIKKKADSAFDYYRNARTAIRRRMNEAIARHDLP